MGVKVERMDRLTSRGGGSWPSVCPDGGNGILRLSVRVSRAGVDIFQCNRPSNGGHSSQSLKSLKCRFICVCVDVVEPLES